MDLEYLLFLQNNVRTEWLTPIMMGISDFAISFWLMSIMFIIYWCVSKKAGYLIMCSTMLGNAINGIVKLSCCIYRPWIRNPQIIPASDSIKTATGYSFPSGHTQGATCLVGSSAFITWSKKRWFAILCWIFIAVVAFSRNYLGVHTPQDVVVGFILGVLSIISAVKIQENVNKNDKKGDLKLLTYSLLASITALLYFTYKNYPIDKDLAGNIIVDPEKMMNDSFKAVGMWIGFCISWFIEKYYIDFKVEGSVVKRILRGILGVASLFIFSKFVIPALVSSFSPLWMAFSEWFLQVFFVIVIYPLVIKLLTKKQEKTVEGLE